MVDTHRIEAVSIEHAKQVGHLQQGRVMSFQEKRVLEQFSRMDWMDREVLEVYSCLKIIQGQNRCSEPLGARAVTLAEAAEWRCKFPEWFKPFKAGRLFANYNVWLKVFKRYGMPIPGRINKWLTEGYSVWLDKRKLGRQPGRNRLTTEELAFAQKQASEWVNMGAFSPVSKPPEGIRVCNVVVAYRGGKMDRICWAGGTINEAVKGQSFRMESLLTVVRMMRPGDYMFSFDLKKGYFQVPLKENFKQFTYMRIGDRFYKWNVLMFGLASAPRDFSLIIKKVMGILRMQGIRCCFYIDDIIFFASSMQEACRVRESALELFHTLGFHVSWAKSLLKPGQLIRHLGMDLSSVDVSVWVPEDKVMRLKQLAGDLLQRSVSTVSGREVATVVGILGSFRIAVPAALILSRGLMRTLAQLPVVQENWESMSGWEVRDYEGEVKLSALAKAELRFWIEGIWKIRGTRTREVASTVSFVDACPEGAGAVVARRFSAGTGVEWKIQDLRAGAWEQRIQASSTVFELLNIWNVVEEFKNKWSHETVLICSDNVGAVFIMGKGCMKNNCLHALSLAVWRTSWEYDIQLCAQYIGGDGIIASGADGLSRDSEYGDGMLKESVFAQIWEIWRPEVDLFCSPETVQKHPHTGQQLLAVSPYRCRNRVGTDGLTFSSARVLYAFPPSAVLMSLIARVRKLGLKVVLVLPCWPQAPWWPLVCEYQYWSCGKVQDCVISGQAGLCHPFGPSFDIEEAKHTEMRAIGINM